jgi:L-alanine-DL-glutamate epimerase-like enolase superfamily enzyme
MTLTRRELLLAAAAATASAAETDPPRTAPDYEKPLFNLRAVSTSPIKIKSIEVLKAGNTHFIRSTSTDGAVGMSACKGQVEDYIPILLRRVIPFFTGKDARDLESLIDKVYIQNYKMAGQPFWVPVGTVEHSLFDLLGKVANKPVADLLGGMKRKEIPVYLSGSGRETTAEEEVDVYVKAAELTGAKAAKFKIGGRMSRNADAYPGRTKTMLPLARKRFGDKMILYADANGSYDAKVAIEVGRMMESLNYTFFEEPCPWEEMDQTKRVASALKIPIAGGECDTSLWKFQWMIGEGMFRIIQPDLSYSGGLIRASRIARMARAKNLSITPHNTQTGADGAMILHFAAATPNAGPFMEWPWRKPPKPASWYTPNLDIKNGVIPVPTGPGLGISYDPDYLKKAVRVEA